MGTLWLARAPAWRPLAPRYTQGAASRYLSTQRTSATGRTISSVASPSPLPERVSPQTLKDRQPKPDAFASHRVTYKGGLSRSKGRSLFGRVMGRWRGTTIDLNFDFRSWHRHEEASRHVRLWAEALFLSQTLWRQLNSDLIIVGGVASAIVAYNSHILHEALNASPALVYEVASKNILQVTMLPGMVALPTQPFALSSLALGLLVTFRTQACHGRYVEARILWGTLVNVSRDLASRILCTVPPTSPANCALREKGMRLIRTFPRTVKYHLTVDGFNEEIDIEGCSPADTLEKTDVYLGDELSFIWNEKDAFGPAGPPPTTSPAGVPVDIDFPNRLLRVSVRSRPLWVIQELGDVISEIQKTGAAGAIEVTILNNRVLEYNNVLGAMERIMRTPIYTPYR